MVKLGFLWVESILQRQQTKDNRRYDNTSSWDTEGEGLLPWHFSSCRKIGGSLGSRKKMWVTAIPRWTQTTIVNNNKADSLCQYKDEFLSRLSIALFCPQFLKSFFLTTPADVRPSSESRKGASYSVRRDAFCRERHEDRARKSCKQGRLRQRMCHISFASVCHWPKFF